METAVLLLKKEPVSPPTINCDEASTELLYENDTIFYQSDNEHDNLTPPSEGVLLEDYDIKLETAEFDDILVSESKAQVASQILENLENLMDLDDLIKEEPLLLDEKMLPILEEVPPTVRAYSYNNVSNMKMDQYHLLKSPDTFSLMKEFQNIYDIVEYQHGALTPPQSPPSQPMFTTLEPIMAPSVNYNQQQILPDGNIKQPLYSSLNLVPEKQQLIMPSELEYRQSLDYQQVATPQPDIAHELAVVDELVRTRVEDMTSWIESGPSSPNSSSSCSSSNFGDSSVSDDPEWMPEMIQSAANELIVPKNTKKGSRSKPYSRNSTEDKKSRKKEQNKNAATRYRLKKKAEVEEILTEEKTLLDKNGELGNKITDLQREIKYLKGLMRDLFKAKGLIN